MAGHFVIGLHAITYSSGRQWGFSFKLQPLLPVFLAKSAGEIYCYMK